MAYISGSENAARPLSLFEKLVIDIPIPSATSEFLSPLRTISARKLFSKLGSLFSILQR